MRVSARHRRALPEGSYQLVEGTGLIELDPRPLVEHAHTNRSRPTGTRLVHLKDPSLELVPGPYLLRALDQAYELGEGSYLLPRALDPLVRSPLELTPSALSSAVLTKRDTPEVLEAARVLLADGNRTARQALAHAHALL